MTIGVTFNFYKSAKTKDQIRFSNQANRFQASIDSRINLYIALLKGGRGFVETSSKLNRAAFAGYVNRLDLQNNYAGVQGIGFSRLIKSDDRKKLIEQIKSDGDPNFSIFPEGDREQYQAVVYIEPLTELNRKVLGYDMETEAGRREAMEQARDSGDAAASGRVTPVWSSAKDQADGFVVYLPIYKDGMTPASIEERKKNLLGYIYSPFQAENFLDEIYKNIPDKDVAIKIYDSAATPENLMAQTANVESKKFAMPTDETYVVQNDLEVAGRRWVLEFTTLPTFAEQSSVGWTPLIFLSGICFSFLLFGMTYWEAAARAKLQITAAELFELQKEKEILFDNERRARQIAEQANQTKDEFISIISHELKTPLNAIAGWTRILKTKDVSNSTKELALLKIDKNLRSQASLVEELLNYSEIISGKVNLKDEQINFSEMFENTYEEFESLASEKQIELSKENFLANQIVSGDKDKLRLVIYNLLSNAVKFTPIGGKVEINVRENEGAVQMSVRDNGRGINPEFLPHIFEQYKQADTPNTRDYGGLGLGLTICKHIIDLHRGTIEAESAGREKGSQFTVKIPLHNGSAHTTR